MAQKGGQHDADQVARERTLREAARGMRARAVLRGDLGAVLKRWVSASTVPSAARLRAVAEDVLERGGDQAAVLLRSPVFGLPDLKRPTKPLRSILTWARKEGYAEDLVLSVLGTAVGALAGAEVKTIPLTGLVMACGDAARECALGQFITQVQGAKAMARVRTGKDADWKSRKQMDAIAGLLAGQVRSALPVDPDEELPLKAVVHVKTVKGDGLQRIELRPPAKGDWDLLEVARHVKGEADPHRHTWGNFALLVLCAAQAEAGWFALGTLTRADRGQKPRRYQFAHRASHGLSLSEEAHAAIKNDIQRWLSLGFLKEPMTSPPEDGDYLTVKHRAVLGGKGPMGAKTRAEGTTAWQVASRVMARTPWEVHQELLKFVTQTEGGQRLALEAEPDDLRRELILGQAGRLAQSGIYLPIAMDFRGRVYTQPTLLTYQGGDLQKALLRFPAWSGCHDRFPDELAMHCSALYGGPDKLDKAAYPERMCWFLDNCLGTRPTDDLVAEADEPLQLWAALRLIKMGLDDQVACQIDGTCNGLQHLTAMFRDETAAPWVNLCASPREVAPKDLYGEVARRVHEALAGTPQPWARRVLAAVPIDRKLCKKPVMVLPYGGVKATIEESVLAAAAEREEYRTPQWGTCPWRECLMPALTWEHGQPGMVWVRDEEAVAADYLAFRDRELVNHPLFRLDMKRLGGLVWDVIGEVLPRPLAAMAAFRKIASYVKGRSLEWTCGYGEEPLWIVQAKSKAASRPLSAQGWHLPQSIRSLSIREGRDEVDPRTHGLGIVANFIHSQDADHLARTMGRFTGHSFGAIHDCFITRPSSMRVLREATRDAFAYKYLGEPAHPLLQPVRLRDIQTGALEEFTSWYALADAAGALFPTEGSWDPREVLESAWFFS